MQSWRVTDFVEVGGETEGVRVAVPEGRRVGVGRRPGIFWY